MARILVTKLGLDGHDVGCKIIAVEARDAGHEVVYLGIRQSVESVTRAAVDEGVDVVAVSMLSGAHSILLPRLVDSLRSNEVDAPIVVGGMIPKADVPALLAAGVTAVIDAGVSGPEAVRQLEATLTGPVSGATPPTTKGPSR